MPRKKHSVHGRVGTKGERKRSRQSAHAAAVGKGHSRTATRRKKK